MRQQPQRRPTILDVARLAKVGVMTVSRVINDYPGVRPGTRHKVTAAIASLGYEQNEAARQLKGRRAMIVGLIVPDLSDSFFAICAHTVQRIARVNGYMTLVVSSERDPDLEIQEAELMARRNVSGLIVVTSLTGDDDRLRQLQANGLAIVALTRPLRGMDTDCVVVENRAGAEAAVTHLINHGHREIVCLGYDHQVYSMKERIEGYANSMRTAGLKAVSAISIENLEDAREWLTKTLASKRRPTAIFALNHRVAVFIYRVMAEAGLGMPQDMALIGFDEFDLASLLSPPLTTVAQSPVELVKRSMVLLFERIKQQQEIREFVPAKIVLPVTLSVRSSCGCPPEKTR